MMPEFLLGKTRYWMLHDIMALTTLVTCPIIDLVVIPMYYVISTYWLTVVYTVMGLLWVTFIEHTRHSG